MKQTARLLFALLLSGILFSTLCMASEITTPGTLEIWDGTVASGYAGGDGTESNPYIISNGAELAFLMSEVSSYKQIINEDGTTVILSNHLTKGKYYKMVCDIYLNDLSEFEQWEENPPANEWISGGDIVKLSLIGFEGYFDGNNYDIKGLYINKPNESYKGLFGVIVDGSVSNLTITHSYVKGFSGISALAGCARYSLLEQKNSITGITVENSTVCGSYSVGAVLGHAEGFYDGVGVFKCESNAKVSGSSGVGGIIGVLCCYNPSVSSSYTVKISDCVNSGDVFASESYAGGIVGDAKSIFNMSSPIMGLIERCTSNGSVFSPGVYGAIVGQLGPEDKEDLDVIIHVFDCFATNGGKGFIYGMNNGNTSLGESAMLESAGNKADYKNFDFTGLWDIINGKPALRKLADVFGVGKVSASGLFSFLKVKTGEDKETELKNVDFNGDGKTDLYDLNAYMQYIKGKGASSKPMFSFDSFGVVYGCKKVSSDSFYTDLMMPGYGNLSMDLSDFKARKTGEIVALLKTPVNGKDIYSCETIGNAYTKGNTLDLSSEVLSGIGYVELESYDSETSELKIVGSDTVYNVQDAVVTFSDKSKGSSFRMVETNILSSTSSAYRQNDDKSNPMRLFMCVTKTDTGNYNVNFCMIVRD